MKITAPDLKEMDIIDEIITRSTWVEHIEIQNTSKIYERSSFTIVNRIT